MEAAIHQLDRRADAVFDIRNRRLHGAALAPQGRLCRNVGLRGLIAGAITRPCASDAAGAALSRVRCDWPLPSATTAEALPSTLPECPSSAKLPRESRRSKNAGGRVRAAGLDRDRALADLHLHALCDALHAKGRAVHRHARTAGLDRERLWFRIGDDRRRERAALQLHGQKFTGVTDQSGRVRFECPACAAVMVDY